MADYRTEEEQIELLKNWWKESGSSTIAGVFFAVAAWLGWVGWQNHEVSQVEAAAALYHEMSNSQELPGAAVNQARQKSIAESLRASHPNTVYAVFAALQMAKTLVESNDLKSASEWLSWAKLQAQGLDNDLATLTAYRLACLQYAQADYENALLTIGTIKEAGAFHASILELNGDIFLAQGKRDPAVNAYKDAIKYLEESGSAERRQYIEMKLADLSSINADNSGEGT